MGRDSEKQGYPINNRTYSQRRFQDFKKMTANAKKKSCFTYLELIRLYRLR